MTTRKQEKQQQKNEEIQKIKETARRRSWGQDAKDNGRWGGPTNRISYTCREKKKLKLKG